MQVLALSIGVMQSIENAAVLRWIPYGNGVLTDGGSISREKTGGILWL
jgi:hypothetical protein